MSDTLHIETFTLGDWMTNCYVVHAASGACWIVDAGFNPESMLRYVQERGLSVQAIVLTHAHIDHVAGLSLVQQQHSAAPILLHEAERNFPAEPSLNLSIALAEPIVAPEPTRTVRAGERLELDGHVFEVRHTPGHSPGGIALYCAEQGVALVGDALFAGGIGRTDFPTSDHNMLIDAIRQQLLSLPDETRILPGHGPESTIGRERATNPFLR